MGALAPTGIHYPGLSDQNLIMPANEGVEKAYSMLIQRHERLVHFILRKYFTDQEAIREVTQDTFL